jgi:hypothetical protein
MEFPEEYKIVRVFGTNKLTNKPDTMSPCFFIIGKFGSSFCSKITGARISDALDVIGWEYMD